MKKTLLIALLLPIAVFSQVGIGTATPAKDLELGGATSTIRIEKLNSTNSPVLNTGGTYLAPAFVNGNGDVTITPPNYATSTGPSTVVPLNFLINVPNFIPDGAAPARGVILNNDTTITTATGFLISIPFTAPQASLVEVKYGVTVVLSSTDMTGGTLTVFSDVSARNYKVYYYIDLNNDGLDATELSKKYGVKGQCYASFNQGIVGYAYMNGQGYANIPAGNHSLKFYAETNDGALRYTSVGFGGDLDYLKIRIYN